MAKMIVPENKVNIQLEKLGKEFQLLKFSNLTPVESLLFPFYALGVSAKRAAKITSRDIKTIQTHWSHCRMKLGLVERYDALKMIIDNDCVLDCVDMIKYLSKRPLSER